MFMNLPNIKEARNRTKDKTEYVYLDDNYDSFFLETIDKVDGVRIDCR